MTRRSAIVTALLATFVISCGGSDVHGTIDASSTCTSDDQCPVGQSCMGGVCASPIDAGHPPDAMPGPAKIVVSPTTVDFGSALRGVTITLPVTITNIGASPLHVSKLEIVEMDALPEYNGAPLGPVDITIPPSQSTIVNVSLTQQDAEVDLGQLKITSNDPMMPLVVVDLVSSLKGTPQLAVTPAVIDYGTVNWGDHPTVDVDITNVGTGNAPLAVSAVSITNTTGMGSVYSTQLFSVDPVTGAELSVAPTQFLGAGDMVTPPDKLRVRVTFDSTVGGSGPIPHEDLVLATNDADPADAMKHVPIQGTTLGCALPGAETCNGLDDNCNLVVDEGDPGGGGGCFTGLPGGCANGTLHCMGGSLTCVDNGGPTPEVCDGLDNNCNGSVDEALVQGCSTACGSGVEFCVGGGWAGCNAPMPSPEACDGFDNNCNGTIDEGDPGSGPSCVTGMFGVCNPGTLHCVGGGLTCLQNTVSSPETCNGLDDNCNGTADEGDPGSGAACTTTELGVCSPGHIHCVAGGLTCVRDVNPSVETCNGLDDDCNGTTDNGDPGGGASCTSTNVGACAPGTIHCVAGSDQCVSNIAPGTLAETCNGVDDNCNGMTDEGDPGSGASCTSTNVGICQPGTQHCVGGAIGCVSNVTPGTQPEICNGLDDNCNGAVDEGNPGSGASCTTGQLGVCSPGHMQCVSGALTCVRDVNPSAETCNGLDDNCDGTADNGDPGGGASCTSTNLGVCQPGTQHCVAGALSCVSNVTPPGSAETCNALDDNCNGTVDEGDPGGGGSCSTGLAGICGPGTNHCVSGTIQCQANMTAHAETCNGLDDDCNGTVDNGDPGGGAVCTSSNLGVCQPGHIHCVAGADICVSNISPPGSPEICNGLDDNCNGTVDEGNPGGGGACVSTGMGICQPGHYVCTAGALVCVSNVGPMTEACNGADDDCNGVVDNGDPGGGGACLTGMFGVCSPGTQHCASGSIQCFQNVGATSEVCNGLDDDCNGTVDNGNPGGGVACSTGMPGVCNPGTTACSSGTIVCNRNVNPSAELCNNLDDNCNGTVDDGAAASCPVVSQVASYTCTGGTCGIGSCQANWYNDDGSYGNGCECNGVAPNTCGSAPSLGALGIGGATSTTANLGGAGQEHWYSVTFNSNTSTAYHPKIVFTANPGGQFAFDVYASCGGSAQSCGTEGGVATARTVWEVLYTAGDPASAFNPIPPVGSGGTVWVRVYRAAGGPTCDNFTLQASN